MKGRYYVMNGFCASGYDAVRIDRLLPKDFRGNAIDKLISGYGYKFDENGVLWTPDNKKLCQLIEVI